MTNNENLSEIPIWMTHQSSKYEKRLKNALREYGKLKEGDCIAIESGCESGIGWILNTNPPKEGNPEGLRKCYISILNKITELKLETISFCCIGTRKKGFCIGFHNDAAAQIAIQTVGTFLKNHLQLRIPFIRRIGFFVNSDSDRKCYQKLLPALCK